MIYRFLCFRVKNLPICFKTLIICCRSVMRLFYRYFISGRQILKGSQFQHPKFDAILSYSMSVSPILKVGSRLCLFTNCQGLKLIWICLHLVLSKPLDEICILLFQYVSQGGKNQLQRCQSYADICQTYCLAV